MKLKKKVEDSIDKLSNVETEPDEFKIWLKRFLIRNISHPLTGYYINEYPYEYLYKTYEATSNIRFQERLRHAVKELFRDCNINAESTESIEYYSNLLNLIAELPVTEMYPDLIETALTGFYCGVILENEDIDIQTLILEVIVGMQVPGEEKIKDRLMDLVRKYIHDARYTPLCFRIAWQVQYENAIQYISLLLECSKKRKFDVYGTIERFLSGCGVAKFKELLMLIKVRLQTSNMWGYFLEILFKLGIKIHVPSFPLSPNYFLLKWELNDQDLSVVQIYHDNRDIKANEAMQPFVPANDLNEYVMTQIEKFDTFSIDQQKKDKEFLEFKDRLLGVHPQPFLWDQDTRILSAQRY